MPKFGYALTASRDEARQMIDQIVSESSTLTMAMESIGAMYGIPSTHIMEDPNAKNVTVAGDTIICPANAKANGNTNTIVRAISGVLDQISQRVDDQLTNIQSNNMDNGAHDETLMNRTDPSKGKVVITTVDANGDPVIVYDSGIIDCAHTPEGRAKADQLRNQENIPTFDPLKKEKPSYFNDEDDVRCGVNMEADNPDKNPFAQPIHEYDLSEIVATHRYFIDAIAKYGDTRALGFDVFTKHGYDCVQPMGEPIMEADAKPTINANDLKHMKFDNHYIVEAVKYLNAARAEQPDVKKVTELNMDQFVKSPNYQKAIDCLDKQFDCRLAIKWANVPDQKYAFAGTSIIPSEYRTKLVCSKSKGFQLNGAPIHITVAGEGVSSLIPDDPSLFGQATVSILLHEIFHNIAWTMRYETGQFVTSLNVALTEAALTRDPKMRKQIIERYVNALNIQMKGKLNRVTRHAMVKELTKLASEQSDENLKAEYNDAASSSDTDAQRKTKAETELKTYTKMYKKYVKRAKPHTALNITAITLGGINAVFGILTAVAGYKFAPLLFGVGALTGLGGGITAMAIDKHMKNLRKEYKNTREMEEYYADLFAAMYQLPQRFFNAASRRKYTPNDVSQELLNDYVKAEKAAYETIMIQYPTHSERTYAGVRTAQKLLECKELDPSIRKYLEWIVANHDQILKTGIESDYNQHTFDPKNAEDLDKHLVSMVKNNKVEVTESYDMTPYDDDQFIEEFCALTDRVNNIAVMMENGYFDDIYEEAYATKVTGYKDESIGKRIIMMIPRLIAKCLESIGRLLKFLSDKLTVGIAKVVNRDKMYDTQYDLRTIEKGYVKVGDALDRMDQALSGAEDITDYVDRIKKLGSMKLDFEFDPDYEGEQAKGRLSMKRDGEDTHKMVGSEITRILKHILDYSRTDLTPKLKRVNKQFDRITKSSSDKWAELQDDKNLKDGLKIFNQITQATTWLTNATFAIVERIFARSKNGLNKDMITTDDIKRKLMDEGYPECRLILSSKLLEDESVKLDPAKRERIKHAGVIMYLKHPKSDKWEMATYSRRVKFSPEIMDGLNKKGDIIITRD